MKKNLLLLAGILLQFAGFAQNFTSSNLPIIIIHTNGQNIEVPYQKFYVDMGIIDNGVGQRNHVTDPWNNYNGQVEIDLHGSSTLWFPKKSFAIKTVNGVHQSIKTSILGMPPEDDWILKAHYQDKTLMRDELGFYISQEMGHYSSRSRYVEIVIDGDYKGVYEVEEKIKRDNFRVDISKLKPTEVTGDDLTGGYIISLDKCLPGEEGWYSQYYSNATHDSANYFLYVYPKPDSMPQVQKNYIKNYFDRFENVLVSPNFNDPDTGYSKYIDMLSFIDNFIINEASKNVDGYRSSTYFYKDKDSKGGKLVNAPVWDFNIAWDNCAYNGGHSPSGWQYQTYANDNFVPFWWWQFMSDPAFINKLKCRYIYLRNTTLKQSNLEQHIDQVASLLNEAQVRNFNRWPIMGQVVYPNPSPVPGSYAGEISNLKAWLQNRLAWMDANLPGVCNEMGLAEQEQSAPMVRTFPNPFTGSFSIVYTVPSETPVKLEVINMVGQVVKATEEKVRPSGMYEEQINTADLQPGVYMTRLTLKGGKSYYCKSVKLGE